LKSLGARQKALVQGNGHSVLALQTVKIGKRRKGWQTESFFHPYLGRGDFFNGGSFKGSSPLWFLTEVQSPDHVIALSACY
jgi:hypothetical protein